MTSGLLRVGALAAASLAAAAPVTFSEHIAPILFERCVECHRPGATAPFALLSYEDARKHAAQIAAVTARRYMPPWPPAPGVGDFLGNRRLSDAQIAMLAQWAKDGAPEGDPAKTPHPPQFTDGWQSGEPDLILKMREGFTLPASGPDEFRNFVVPVPLTRSRFVRALELRPGNARAIHHANVIVDRGRTLRSRDGQDGRPGFDGMDVAVESANGFDPDSHFLFWKPGSPAAPLPDDMAWRIDPDTDLIVNLHLQPTGKPETVEAMVGLYFTDQPPRRQPMLLQLEHDGAIDIPPGSASASVADHLILPIDVDLLAIYPHAHYLGKRVEAWAELPGGLRTPLLRIDDWDINWQATYTYRTPVHLPAGTRVVMQISYDNRAGNPRNPNHPPRRVRAGDRATDEMGHLWLQVLPANTDSATVDPRLRLQEALMRRRLEKYPGDFEAAFNLGAALAALGKKDEALRLLERSVQLRPQAAVARNALAAELIDAGRLAEATAQLRAAVRGEPHHADSHFNLARTLVGSGDAVGAEAEYLEYLRLRPDDVEARIQLAGLYADGKKFRDAAIQFGQASKLRPDDADLQTNLGTSLTFAGDLTAAIGAFERALALKPDHALARSNLEQARAILNKGK